MNTDKNLLSSLHSHLPTKLKQGKHAKILFFFYVQIQRACVGVGPVARALRDILFGIKWGTGIWEVALTVHTGAGVATFTLGLGRE